MIPQKNISRSDLMWDIQDREYVRGIPGLVCRMKIRSFSVMAVDAPGCVWSYPFCVCSNKKEHVQSSHRSNIVVSKMAARTFLVLLALALVALSAQASPHDDVRNATRC